jgi:hypothetical protein
MNANEAATETVTMRISGETASDAPILAITGVNREAVALFDRHLRHWLVSFPVALVDGMYVSVPNRPCLRNGERYSCVE